MWIILQEEKVACPSNSREHLEYDTLTLQQMQLFGSKEISVIKTAFGGSMWICR